MTTAEATSEAAHPSFWQIHTGHVLLLAAWLVTFGALYARTRLQARRASSGPGATPALGTPRPVALWIAALSSVASGAVHLSVIREHFEEATLYGTFFLVLTVVQLAWAIGLVSRPSRALLLSGAAASALVAVLWLATRTIGIPVGPAAGETEPFGGLDIVASAAELLVAVSAGWALGWFPSRTRSDRKPVVAPLV